MLVWGTADHHHPPRRAVLVSHSSIRQRPYHVENTGSRPITEVKQRRARLVLGWVTAWEHRVLLAFFRAGIAQLVVHGLAVHGVAGSILLWGHFPVEGIFPLELTWVLLLLLVRQMEIPVSPMKVAVHRRSLRLPYSLRAKGVWSGQIPFLSGS